MRRLVQASLFLVSALASALSAKATPMVSLSSLTNLTTLTVGQDFEVDVTLSGLTVGSDSIFNLDSHELFSSSLFTLVPNAATSSGMTPGTILSAPSQAVNFNSASSLTAGNAIGDFSNSSPSGSTAISVNGLFYSFELQATGIGSGSIQFSSAAGVNQYSANDTGFAVDPISTGAPLAFSIGPAANTSQVPEPPTFGLVGVFGTAATLAGWMVRKQRISNRVKLAV